MSQTFVTAVDIHDLGLGGRARGSHPLSFDLEVTARCNLDCRHCYINRPAGDHEARSKELSLAQITRIAREAVAMGALWCLVTGGEPLLREDFLEIYLMLKRLGLLVAVFTNASLVTPRHVEVFRRYPPRDVEVTVYGATQATYERVTRRPGSFAAFRRGLDLLLAGGVPVRLKAMVLKSNLHELDEISRFCRKRTKDFYRFDPLLHLRYDGDPERNEAIRRERLAPEEIVAIERADRERFGALVRQCGPLARPASPNTAGNRLFHCGAGEDGFAVGYDGAFRLCSGLCHPDTIYDLCAGTLAEAYRQVVPRVRGMVSDRPEFLDHCRGCRLADLCLCCPAHAALETGRMDGWVPYYCACAHARADAVGQEPDETSRLLLGFLRKGPGRALPTETVPEALSREQWDELMRRAAGYGITPLLYRRLVSLRSSIRVPDDVFQEFRAAYLLSAKRNVRLYHELAQVLRALGARGIPVIVLKGAHLAEGVYGNLAVRPMGDLDLLAKKADLAEVEAALLGMGYGGPQRPSIEVQCRDRHTLLHLAKAEAAEIDVHWSLAEPASGFRIDVDGLWERSRPASVAGVPGLVLSHEDLLLSVCLHAGYHHAFCGGLKSLVDIAEICGRYRDEIDWERLRLRAREWGAERCVYLAARLAREWLDAPIPAEFLSGLKPQSPDAPWLAAAQGHVLGGRPENLFAVPMTRTVSQLWGPKSAWRRLRLLLARLFPSRQELALSYPAPPDSLRIWFYYPVRLKDLASRYGRAAWRALLGDARARATIEQSNREVALRAWLTAGDEPPRPVAEGPLSPAAPFSASPT
jgi:radical SAM protein with 4Fe4S-binding SPASM domain